MDKIIILIPYFGSWPNYIQIYNETCKYNSLIKICFITDLAPFENASKNICFFQLSFLQLKEKIENIFKITIPNHKPYKMCDFRPAYAVIFNDLIKDYDFWGYGDIDLIYGNLSKFLTKEVLQNNDIIAFRPDHLHGPFTLYKNSEFINNLFKKSENYIEIFKDNKYRSFDEFGTINFIMHSYNNINELPNDTISIIALKEIQKGYVKAYMKLCCKEKISDTNEIIKYDNGIVINQRTNEEYSFYHWVIEKRAKYFKYPKSDFVPNIYYVSQTGFYTEKQFKYYQLINFYRKMNGIIYWYFLRLKNYPLRRLGFKIIIDTYPKPGFIKK